MPNSRGCVFVSYRRKRLRETEALVRALEDRGVPTWLDINNLGTEPTEAAIRAALNDEDTAGAILWLTPDVDESPIIRDVEVPEAVRRRRRDGSFWLVIVLADGLTYSEAGEIFAKSLAGEDLSMWNLTKVTSPWATQTDIAQIALVALTNSIKTTCSSAGSSTTCLVSVHAKGTMVSRSDETLTLDWTGYFVEGPPSIQDWATMSDAAHDVATVLKREVATNGTLVLGGTPSLPASVLIGSTYSGRDGVIPTWIQRQPDGSTMSGWSMTDAKDAEYARASGWSVPAPTYGDANGTALALCISISDDVSAAFARSQHVVSGLRAILRVEPPDGRNTRALPLTPQEAASLVHLCIDQVRSLRKSVLGIDLIHLFVAGPAGFGVLLGTQLATLPPIVTYEFDTVTGEYARAVVITT